LEVKTRIHGNLISAIRSINDPAVEIGEEVFVFIYRLYVDTSVFDTTRGYYSNWFDKNMTVQEVASFIYRASSIYGDTAILGDYI